MYRKIVSIVILAAISIAAFAQDEGRVAHPFRRSYHVVETAELVQADDGLELVLTGYLPEGCDAETVINSEVVGTTWFIDLYHQVPFDEVCPQYYVPRPFEERLDASVLFGDDADTAEPAVRVIVANRELFGVEPTGDESAPLTLSETFVRGPLPYTDIVLRHTPEQTMEITLSGVLSDACPIPVYRAVEDWQNPGFVTVEAYTAINIAAMCLQAETPFEVTMTSPLFDSVAINGISVPHDPAISVDTQRFVKQQMAVESATAEWVEGVLPNIKVTVNGIVDGCEDPIQLVAQPWVDNTVVVEVARVIRDGQVCTMIAREFTEEIYLAPALSLEGPIMIMVNGITVMIETE